MFLRVIVSSIFNKKYASGLGVSRIFYEKFQFKAIQIQWLTLHIKKRGLIQGLNLKLYLLINEIENI